MLSIFRIRIVYWRNCLQKIDNQSPDFVFKVLEIRVHGKIQLFELNEKDLEDILRIILTVRTATVPVS